MKTSFYQRKSQLCKVMQVLLLLVCASAFVLQIKAQSVVKHPVSEISTEPTFYSYTYDIGAGYKNIRYFILKSTSGDIKTAFDACDICYSADKGFKKQGDKMQCNNCGKLYGIEGLGTENIGGGCWPGYLPRSIVNDTVIIEISDLEGGEHYFKLIPGTFIVTRDNSSSNCLIMRSGDEIIIKMQSDEKRNFHLIGLNGKEYNRKESSSREFSMNIGDLPPGIYLLKIEEYGNSFCKLFIIQ